MPRHVVATTISCPRCQKPASCTYVAVSGSPKFRFSASIECRNCGLAQEEDGPALTDVARETFCAAEGHWSGLVRDLGPRKLEALRALQGVSPRKPYEVVQLVREGKPIVEGTLAEIEQMDALLRPLGIDLLMSRSAKGATAPDEKGRRVSSTLANALERIFGDLRGGFQFLELPDEIDVVTGSVEERARQLRAVLEGYVISMANEIEELGDEERPRLQSEARATLVALRELTRLLPETAG